MLTEQTVYIMKKRSCGEDLNAPGRRQKRRKTLISQGLSWVGGRNRTRTNGLTSLRSFGQVRNRRTAALERRLYLLLTTLPPRFIPHCGRIGSAPHDVNDVLSVLVMFATKTQDLVV